jgi:hypothetical protein
MTVKALVTKRTHFSVSTPNNTQSQTCEAVVHTEDQSQSQSQTCEAVVHTEGQSQNQR